MTEHYDVAVVGGGAIGGSVAFHLAKKGIKVLLLEKGRTGSGASSAAGGMLGAQSEMHEKGPFFDLARLSRAKFPLIAEELKELTGIDIGLVQKGLLKVAATTEQAEECRDMIAFQVEAGERAEWLTSEQAREVEPALTEKICGAMYIPGDGQVLAPELSEAYVKAAAALGATVKEYTEVKSLIIDGDRVSGLITEQGTVLCERVVVAGGIGSNGLLKQAGLSLDIYPVKGECFSAVTQKPLLETTIFSKGCYLVPKRGGRILVGATMVEGSYDLTVSVEGLMGLMDKAVRLVPLISTARWEKSWAGLRPQTRDGLPYLGEVPGCKGLYAAAGHYRNGILLSPITGELVADLISGKQTAGIDLDAFRPNRHIASLTAGGI